MNERGAIQAVEEKYGSLEEFALYLIEHGDSTVLSESTSIVKKAEELDLSAPVVTAIMKNSPKFRALMRSIIVNHSFDLDAEAKHVQAVTNIAMNAGRRVVTNKGTVVNVDNSERGVIEAGKYLNELRETPVSSSRASNGSSIVINFGEVIPDGSDEVEDEEGAGVGGGASDRTITVEGKTVKPHRPLRAGALPPVSARRRYDENSTAKPPFGDTAVGRDLDFVSQEAPGAEKITQDGYGKQ